MKHLSKKGASRGAIFNTVSNNPIPSTKFDLSFWNKTTLPIGLCVPILCKPTLPGDIFDVSTDFLIRTTPLINPAYIDVQIDIRYFHVPRRLVWDDFDDMITNPDNNFIHPYMSWGDIHRIIEGTMDSAKSVDWSAWQQAFYGTLLDYMCLPVPSTMTNQDKNVPIQTLPFRCYAQIWNDWYRDENYQDPISFSTAGGVDDVISSLFDNSLSKRGLMVANNSRDYFTSILPSPQFGTSASAGLNFASTNVNNTPLDLFLSNHRDGNEVNANKSVYFQFEHGQADNLSVPQTFFDLAHLTSYLDNESYSPEYKGSLSVSANDSPVGNSHYEPNNYVSGFQFDAQSFNHVMDNYRALMDVHELRNMLAVQKFRESLLVGGHRIKEYTMSQFGTYLPDERAQMAEYLGGNKFSLQISEVQQTSETTQDSPLGDLAGRGVAAGGMQFDAKYHVTEFGYLFAIAVIRPVIDYIPGLGKDYTDFDYFSYFNPMFDHLGEEEILKRELIVEDENDDGLGNQDLLGYQQRNARYKYFSNEVHGELANPEDSMSSWVNNGYNIQCQQTIPNLLPITNQSLNIFALNTENGMDYFHNFVCMFHHNITAVRRMSKYSTPDLVG